MANLSQFCPASHRTRGLTCIATTTAATSSNPTSSLPIVDILKHNQSDTCGMNEESEDFHYSKGDIAD